MASMTIYRVAWHECEAGRCQYWSASKREAGKRLTKEKKRDDKSGPPPALQLVKVPRAAADLAQWLNANFPTDNG